MNQQLQATVTEGAHALWSEHGLRLHLVDSRGWWVDTELVRFDAAGGAVWYGDKGASRFHPGQEVEVQAVSMSLEVDLSAFIEVTSCSEIGDGWRYDFNWVDPERIFNALPVRVRHLLNRRGAVRVEPMERVLIDLSFDQLELSVEGRLEDISVTGMSVVLRANEAESIPPQLKQANGLQVTCDLMLPESAQSLHLVGVVRDCQIGSEDRIRLAVGFTGKKRVAQESLIVRYVMRRQREDLQALQELQAS